MFTWDINPVLSCVYPDHDLLTLWTSSPFYTVYITWIPKPLAGFTVCDVSFYPSFPPERNIVCSTMYALYIQRTGFNTFLMTDPLNFKVKKM